MTAPERTEGELPSRRKPIFVGVLALAALVIGFLVVRTHGIYFIMVTMAFAQMVFFIFFDNKALGGSDGLFLNFRPDAGVIDLENKQVFYYFTLACLIAVYVFLRRLLWSPFGRALSGIRVNEHRMRALGFNTFSHKLAAFTLAGALAGLAGYLWAAQTGFVNPELMGFHMSAHAIMMVILGGMGNVAGALIGAFGFEQGQRRGLPTHQALQSWAHKSSKSHHHSDRIAGQTKQHGMVVDLADAAHRHGATRSHGNAPKGHIAQLFHHGFGGVGFTHADTAAGDDGVGLRSGAHKGLL